LFFFDEYTESYHFFPERDMFVVTRIDTVTFFVYGTCAVTARFVFWFFEVPVKVNSHSENLSAWISSSRESKSADTSTRLIPRLVR